MKKLSKSRRSLLKFTIMAKDHVPDYQQFPSEFLSDGDLYQIFMSNKLMLGRMISGSKSGYYAEHPGNLIVFNANIALNRYHTRTCIYFFLDNVKSVCYISQRRTETTSGEKKCRIT